VWAKPDPEWADQWSTMAPSTFETMRARLESFLSPKKPKHRPMRSPETPPSLYPATSDGGRRYLGQLFSPPLNAVDDYPQEMYEPRVFSSPMSVRHGDYFPDELLARNHLNKGWISENWNKPRNQTDYTTSDVDHFGRNLFPLPNSPLSPENWHYNNSNPYRERNL